MKIFSSSFRLPIRWVILVLFLFLIACLIIYLFKYSATASTNFDANLSSIVGGLIAGFIIACTQFLLSWFEYKRNDKLEKIGVIDILTNKYAENKYRNIIKNLQTKLFIIGNTTHDLLNDFADEGNSQDEKKVLLSKLATGLDVKILIAKREYLDSKAQTKFDNSTEKIRKLTLRYRNFQIKFYEHAPTQSIFIFDEECFVGPVFPGKSSRETPALHMKNESEFAKKYIEYFNNEWDRAVENTD